MALDIIIKAMEEEIIRSKKLKIKGYKEKPYFISYLAKQGESIVLEASNGCIDESLSYKNLEVMATVRVGSHKEDGMGIAYTNLPLPEHNTNSTNHKTLKMAMRKKLWSITDLAFKQALTEFFENKSTDVELMEEETNVPDFSIEDINVYREKNKPLLFEKGKWKTYLREVSKRLTNYPHLLDSSIALLATKQTSYFLSTEGTILRHQRVGYNLMIEAITRGINTKTKKEDGSTLLNFKTYRVANYKDLPTLSQLEKDIADLVGELMLMREADILTPGLYPTIIGQDAHGVLWHEVIGHRLEGHRISESGSSNPFEGRVGDTITSPFITIEMDPTLEYYGNKFLDGYYKFDDEGIKAQKLVLVEKGVLKNFMMSRKPIKDMNGQSFTKSNGHGRIEGIGHEPVPRMSNLIVLSHNECSYEELKKRLITICRKRNKPYGLIIPKVSGGETDLDKESFVLQPVLAYKIDVKTGKETPVRGFEINGTPLRILESIVATDNNYDISGGFCGAESGFVPTAEVAPRALLSDLEVKKVPNEKMRGTILPSP